MLRIKLAILCDLHQGLERSQSSACMSSIKGLGDLWALHGHNQGPAWPQFRPNIPSVVSINSMYDPYQSSGQSVPGAPAHHGANTLP